MIGILGVAATAWTVVEVATTVTAIAGSVTAVITTAKTYYEYKKLRDESVQTS